MYIRRRPPATQIGAHARFTGTVFLDSIGPDAVDSSFHADLVHFTPTARTAWHHHPAGQLIQIMNGVGRVGRRGRPAEEVRAGDTVWFEADEEHWHGAGPDNFMTHLAVRVADADGRGAIWGELVSDSDYDGREVDGPPVRHRADLEPARTRDGSEIRWVTGPTALRAERQSVADTVIEAGGEIREHYHRVGEEVYLILDGDGDLYLDGVAHQVGAGDSALVAPGVRHKLANTGAAPLRLVTTCAPAFGEDDLFLVD